MLSKEQNVSKSTGKEKKKTTKKGQNQNKKGEQQNLVKNDYPVLDLRTDPIFFEMIQVNIFLSFFFLFIIF